MPRAAQESETIGTKYVLFMNDLLRSPRNDIELWYCGCGNITPAAGWGLSRLLQRCLRCKLHRR